MNPSTENIDPHERNKFSELASDWWNPDGELQTLHDINPARLSYIEKHTSINNKLVLDVGCGGGILSEALAKKGAQVTGIDVAEESLQIANEHAKQFNLNIDYQCTTVENFSSGHENSYDVITCMELLEHVPDPASVINACMTLIKPDGLIFLSTVNRNLKAYLQTKVAAEYILKLLPRGTHDYSKYIRPSELASWCRDSDFTVKDISGLHYLPYLRKCSLSDKPDVNYLLCAQALDKKS